MPHSISELEIAEQMAIAAEFSDGFLHVKSGTIYRLHEFEPHSEFLPLIQAGELHLIPTITSQDLYLWMEEFITTVSDAELQNELNNALGKIGGVWKFRNILYHAPEMERRWELFQKKKLLSQSLEWLGSFKNGS